MSLCPVYKNKKDAFSLMEMMIVLLIIAIIAAATAPMVTKKIARSASGADGANGSSPWTYTGFGNSISFNMSGAGVSALIGSAKLPKKNNYTPRLYINTNEANPIAIGFGHTGAHKADLSIKDNSITFNGIASGMENAGSNAVAIGMEQSLRNNNNIVALGHSASTAGPDSVAIGYKASAANGAVSIGDENKATGDKTISIGYKAKALNSKSLAIGNEAEASLNNSVAIGDGAKAQDHFSTSVGGTASGNSSVAIGYNSQAAKNTATALGTSAKALEQGSVAIGFNNEANKEGAVAVGLWSESSGVTSIAIGANAKAKSDCSISIGDAEVQRHKRSIAIGDKAFVGKDSTVNMEFANDSSMAIGSNSFAWGVQNIALGPYTYSRGNGNIAIGSGADALALYGGTAIGGSSYVEDSYGIAIGHGATDKKNTKKYSGEPIKKGAFGNIAIGRNAIAWLGTNSTKPINIAIGADAYAVGKTKGGTISIGAGAVSESNENSIAIGCKTNATMDNSIAIGAEANAAHTNSIAIGKGVSTTENNQLVLGTDSHKTYIPGSLKVDKGITGTVSTPSDRRLKNVGEKFTGGLNELKKLELFRFTYKKDEEKTPHVGVMAQDLQKVFPNAVSKDSDGFLQIRFEDMFYALINAVKELDSKIANAFVQIKANADKISKLQEKIDSQAKVIESQQKTIDELNMKFEAQNAEFEKRLAKLEKGKK